MLKRTNQKLAVGLAVLALIYLVLSFRLPSFPYALIDADVIPKALGVLLFVLSVLLFFEKERTEQKEEEPHIPRGEWKVLMHVLFMVIGYIVLFPVLGFVIATALFIFICTRYLGYPKHGVNAAVSIAFPIILYISFNYLLKMNLPNGFLPF